MKMASAFRKGVADALNGMLQIQRASARKIYELTNDNNPEVEEYAQRYFLTTQESRMEMAAKEHRKIDEASVHSRRAVGTQLAALFKIQDPSISGRFKAVKK